jgi:hypothetical protein
MCTLPFMRHSGSWVGIDTQVAVYGQRFMGWTALHYVRRGTLRAWNVQWLCTVGWWNLSLSAV